MNLSLSGFELPVHLRFERPMTNDELERFCITNDLMRVERDSNGELIVMAPTFSEGGSREADIVLELGIWARADGRGKVFGPSTGFTLPDNSMRSPDASWIRWERWNALSETQRKHSYAAICPEFIIELRSESDSLKPLQDKMIMWIANGAEVAWLIDPTGRAVTIYRNGEAPEELFDPPSVQGTGPVCGFELVMARVWG